MVKPSQGHFIEGIGDDLLYGLGAFLGFMLMTVSALGYFWSTRGSNEEQAIHPDSHEEVESTRTRIQNTQHQNRNGPQNSGQVNQEVSNLGDRHDRNNIRCPICIDEANFSIETNCGHVFCAVCIITYWRTGSWRGPVRCPVCRQVVTILLLNGQETRTNTEENRNIVRNIQEYNRRFSGEPRSLMDYLHDLPTLLRHCLSDFFSIGGLLVMFRVRVILCFIAAIIYFISPLDIIPEAAFGLLGFLDDFMIMLLLAVYVSIIYRQVVAQREAV